ncbi:MAG TPA: histone deacetylase [Myxococcaceae bacterium]|nr:histone deacetylase [Myxococcaceae bacterium]
MSTLLFTDPLFLRHDPGRGHPERPARVEHALEVLGRAPVEGVEQRAPRDATEEEIAAVHDRALIDALKAHRGERVQIDPDTSMSEASYDAAVRAAGAALSAVEAVMGGEAENAFALVRPPGHHAEPGRSMGFCFFNNAAIAAEAALRKGAQRVLIHDWDVHHGNGTQAKFYERREVLYQSVHQYPFYPGTGAAREIGAGAGAGFTVNCGMPGGQGDGDYGALFEGLFLPVAETFRPDLVIVSAGFDPHFDDPLGGMMVTERGFAAMCSALKEVAARSCGGRMVLLLEGGYSLEGLAQSAHACLEVLAGRRKDTFSGETSSDGARALRASREALRGHWPSLG